MTSTIPTGALEGAKTIFETAGLTGDRLAFALDKVYKRHMGYSALEAGGIAVYLTAKEIGACLGLTTRRVNKILAEEGFQEWTDDEWFVLDRGLPYASRDVDDLKWKSTILDVIEECV